MNSKNIIEKAYEGYHFAEKKIVDNVKIYRFGMK